MTDQTPVERGAEALMEAVLAGSRTLSPAQATDAAQTVYEAIDTEQLAAVVRKHRRNRAINFGRDYACLCGEVLKSNSHHVQADHIALAIKNWLTGKEPQ